MSQSQNDVLRQGNKVNSVQTKECLLQVMVLSLTEFIKQLTPVNQNEISTAIVNNYNNNKMKLKLKCALNLFKKYNVNSKRKAFNKLKVFTVSSQKDTYDYGYDYVYDSNSKFNTNNNNSQQRPNKLSYKKPRYDNNNNNNNIETYSPHKVSLSNYQLDSFLSRQERFSQRLKEKKDQHTSKIEEEMRLLYTFSPKVNNYPLHTVNKSNNFISINDTHMNYGNHHDMMISNYNDKGERERKQSAFDRLYKEGTSRIKERNLKDKEGYRSGNESKKVVSKASINKMHKKYVDYEKKKKILQKTFDEEMGITFKPKSFTVGSGYVVDSNFEDRNKKLIEDRNNFIFVYDYLRRSKFNEKVVGGSNDSKLLKEYLQKNNVEIESLMNKYADAAERFAREYNATTMNNNENGAVVLSEDDENEEN